MKKILLTGCLILLVALALTGCKKDNITDEGTKAPVKTDVTTENGKSVPEDSLRLIDGGNVNFRIIYPESSAVLEGESAGIIRTAVEKLGDDFKVQSASDYIGRDETYDKNTIEVLIGATAYEETAEVLSSISYGDWALRVVGNKIVVVGYAQEGTRSAAYALRDMLKERLAEGGKTLYLERSAKADGVLYAAADSLPAYETASGKLGLVNSGDNCTTMTVKNTSESELTAYREKLVAKGYRMHDSYRILDTDNLYFSYVTDQYQVTIVYVPADNMAKIMAESIADTTLIPKAAESYTSVCEPKMWQVGITDTETTDIYNGMSYIFRLADGSFIIEDGGYDDRIKADFQNGRRIYELLREYAPDKNNIVISAWIISHAHTDHIGALDYFVNAYLKKPEITMKNVIWNLPGEGQIKAVAGMAAKVDAYRDMTRALKAANVNIVKAHPGQCLRFADATVDIIYSYDMSSELPVVSFNSTSLITRLTISGKKIILTGDTTGDFGSAMALKMFGSALKADMLQLPHHGWFNDGSSQELFYRTIDADLILWPAGGGKKYTFVRNGAAHLKYFEGYVNYYTEAELAAGKQVTQPNKIILLAGWQVTEVRLSKPTASAWTNYIRVEGNQTYE